MQKSKLTSTERLQRQGQRSPVQDKTDTGEIANLIVIGASAGGHQALSEVFKDFSVDMPAAIVVLLHMSLGALPSFKKILGRFSRLPIKEVENQERLQQGFIFVPPPGKSANFTNGIIRVEHEVPEQRGITINHLFKSAAQGYAQRVIGVILTGCLRDGTEGLRAVHEAGGLTIVQDPQEAEFRDMPANAMEGLPVTFCLRLAEIGPALEVLVRRSTCFETGLAVAIRTLKDRAALLVRLAEQSWRNPGTRKFLKSELASLRRDLESIQNSVTEEPPGKKQIIGK